MISRCIAPWRVCLVLAVCVSALFAKSRFLLQSELLTSYSSGTPVKILTAYTYNDSGCRVDKYAYNGADTNAAKMSRTVYSYNADNTCSQEILKSAAGDTLSIVRYAYDANKHPVAVATLTKALAVRFIDSMSYNAGGQLTTTRRFTSGALSFYHDYAYDAGGKKTSDTLYEQPSGSFIATQTVLFAYDANNKVSNEKNYRNTAGTWYLISTNKMAYSVAGYLASVTQYEGDGSSNRMQDSLAYLSDAFGNRTKESHFNSDRVLASTIDYTWLDTQPVLVREQTRQPQSLAALRLPAASYDLRGRRIAGRDLSAMAMVMAQSRISVRSER